MAGVEPTSEKEWQAQYDAQTLVDSEKIKQNPNRHMAAKRAALGMAEKAK